MKSYNKSQELYSKGLTHMVGSVNSPVRAFKSVGGNPLFIKNAKGSKIYDVDGNEYIDLVLSYGPMILGHGNDKVIEAVTKQVYQGFSFGASTENEIILSELICSVFNGMDKIRFVNSGTEATMSAIRLARAFTGKNKIIKFSGCYHGHGDSLLVAAGSGMVTYSLPGSAGVPENAVKDTLIAEYNNIESVKTHLSKHDDIAAVFIEPVAGNMGVVIPSDTFIKELRKITHEAGVLLVVDEVMTGFRSKFGGAQDILGIQADITCLGKVIGGGFPVGAYGARSEIMNLVSPLGNMYQAGTLSGNPVAMAAGIATLTELCEQNPYQKFNTQAEQLEKIMLDSARENNIEITVNRFGSMINPFFSKKTVTNFSDAQECDTSQFTSFFWSLLENGIYIPPSQFEAWFLSTTISDDDMNILENGIRKAMKSIRK
ncbi:MAG: glutamate-1-semialdehyde 2,1-aminomutase [Flavobacteriales bacterium]|nr:glutamate-1-semialdehyde 2,1-aminomutase [Flavobacteriales bacterium]